MCGAAPARWCLRFLTLASLIAAALLPAGAPGAEPRDLVYLTEDYPPENFVKDGVLQGYAVETLHAIWRELGVPPSRIEVLPWARAYRRALTRPNTVLFAMARTPERERLFRWVGPIRRTRMALFALAEWPNPGVKRIEDAAAHRVGVMIQDVGEVVLRRTAFPEERLHRVRTLAQLIQMLRAGRVDLICASESALESEMARDSSLKVRYVPVVPLGTFEIYYAFNAATDAALVARFQQALDAVDDERRAIMRRYGAE